jgi:transcriptional regulator with GAF, ATPase, and Fis domain
LLVSYFPLRDLFRLDGWSHAPRLFIFAGGGALDFDVPSTGSSVDLTSFAPRNVDQAEPEYLTDLEIRRRERQNLFAVLHKAGWKIKGVGGAAELLGVRPTTLFARIEGWV